MKTSTRFWLLACSAFISCRSGPAPTPDEAPKPGAAPAAQTAPPPTWKHVPPPPALAATRSAMPLTRTLVLPTGLRVVVVEHHRRPVVVVSLILPRGALMDPPNQSGLTQMAVSLASDYHEVSPTGEVLSEEKSFRREIAGLGGSARFGVESDYTVLRISGYAQDSGAYLRMLSDAVLSPRHGSMSFRGRRNAIIQSIEDRESSDPEALSQVISEAAFGQGHPYGRSPLGTFSSLAQMGVEEAASQQEAILVPGGATLLVVGDFQADQVLATARAAFGRWRGAAAPLPFVPALAVPSNATEISWLERRSASTLVTCATRPLPDVHGSDAALDVLAAMLGQGSGSRLGAALRERSGLTYWANAEIVHRRLARAFIACSALRADQADTGIRLFRDVLEEARNALPSEEELQRAKALRIAQIDSAWEDAFAISLTWVRAIALGSGTPRLEQERAEIGQVTAKEVQKVARAVLSLKTTRWVLSGEKQAATRAVEGNRLGRLQKLGL